MYLVPHDRQEVHAQVLHIHTPFPQGLSSIRVHENARQTTRCPPLVQGFDALADFRDRLKGEDKKAEREDMSQ
jgi:hypothetical protein